MGRVCVDTIPYSVPTARTGLQLLIGYKYFVSMRQADFSDS